MGGGDRSTAAAIVLAAAVMLAGCTQLAGEPVEAARAEQTEERLGENLVVECEACEGGTAILATPTTPASPPLDLLAAGPLAVASFEYDDPTSVRQDGALLPAYPARLKGVVFHPDGDAGPFPLVVLLHGMHQTCSLVGVGMSDACVEPVATRVPNHRGYDDLAQHLASWGMVVVSIDGAQANDRDAAGPLTVTEAYDGTGPALRGDLILLTLERLAEANASAVAGFDALEGRLDLSRIGLMGHSRGGEGVAAAIAQNAARAEPFALRAVLALAPTDFARHDVRGVPFATLLPSCDGDVRSLEGAIMYDDARFENDAPMHAFLVMGANHNFYNSVWTGDDAGGYDEDPLCAEGAELRLTDVEQRATGIALMGGFFRAYLQEEHAYMPYLRGDAPLEGAVCGRFASPCSALAHVSHQPPSAARTLLDAASGDGSQNELGPNEFEGFLSHDVCSDEPGMFPTRAIDPQEHPGCLGDNVHSAPMHNLSWTHTATWRLSLGTQDVSDARLLSFRIGIPPVEGAVSPSLRITLADASGRTASVALTNATPALFVTPSTEHAQTVLSTVRVPLATFEGIDLAQLASVAFELRTPAEGRAVMTDVAVEP